MNSIVSADRPAWAALVLPIALLAASMLLFVAVGAADYPSKIAKEMGHSTAQVAIAAGLVVLLKLRQHEAQRPPRRLRLRLPALQQPQQLPRRVPHEHLRDTAITPRD